MPTECYWKKLNLILFSHSVLLLLPGYSFSILFKYSIPHASFKSTIETTRWNRKTIHTVLVWCFAISTKKLSLGFEASTSTDKLRSPEFCIRTVHQWDPTRRGRIDDELYKNGNTKYPYTDNSITFLGEL